MSALRNDPDRRYCREVLPHVSRTFALNIRLLGGVLGEAVRIGYLMCRAADALEDSWPGTPPEIEARFDTMLAAIGGDGRAAERLAGEALAVAGPREDLRLVANYPRVWRAYRALADPVRAPLEEAVRTMATGMRRFAARAAARAPGAPYLDTEAELHAYCHVVAGCVGEMLTRLARLESPADEATEARRLALAPVVGEALQLTNILLDWPVDVRRGRCHLPAEWLAEHRLAPHELTGADHPGVRAIAGRLEALARDALGRVPDYVALFPGGRVRYRLFCVWPALWAAGSLRAARGDPEFPWGVRRPRITKRALWGLALAALLRVRSDRAIRALFERELAAREPPGSALVPDRLGRLSRLARGQHPQAVEDPRRAAGEHDR
jgi:farnesyl-diphosphate farnesyltransferase